MHEPTFSRSDGSAGPSGDVLESPAPPVTSGEAERIAERHFGIAGSARHLASERDTNYHLVATDGRGYALKFANPAEPLENTNFQTEALIYLERTDPDLPVPKMVPARNGAYEPVLRLSDGRDCVVRLLTWVEGEQVAQMRVGRELRCDIGATLARLGAALAGFDHPAAAHDILWDIKNVPRLRRMTDAIAESDLRNRIETEIAHFEAEVAPRLAGLRQQVIHNDLNHYNIVVCPGTPDRVSGILDFGDMVKTALVIDLAVAASYLTSVDDDALTCVADVVTAYHAVTPLTREEIDLMRDLVVARLVTSICITQWRAARYPENADYILRNNGPARRGIKRFAELPSAQITHHLKRVCDME